MRCHTPARAGFTLLEMLVALAIFSLLAVMSYSGLRVVMEQQVLTEAEAERLGELQKTYLIMQRDIEQAVPRAIRDEYGDVQPAFTGSDMLQLSHGGWSNPLNHPRSSLQRVGYVQEDRQLFRYVWQVLDRAQDSEPLEQPLLEDIEGMEIRYLDPGNEWQDQWPPAKVTTVPPGESPVLPRAVEVTLEHGHYGPLIWLFQLPQ
jgi:general secretion pathway protein J